MARNTGTRAGDADRNAVIDALATAFSEGQLTQPEYEERSRAALQAATLAELRGLTVDLQSSPELTGVPDGPTLPPTHQTTRGIAIGPWIVRLLSIAFLVAMVWVGIRVWGSITDDEGEAESSSSTPASPTDDDVNDDTRIPPIVILDDPAVLTPKGFARLLDLMQTELGSTKVTSLNVQEDYASFNMNRADDPGSWSYYYDGFLGEPSYSESSSGTGPQVDLADINADAVLSLMADLPKRFGIDDYTSRYLFIQFDSFEARGPSLALYVTNASKTGYLTVRLNGKVISEHAPS